MNGLGPTRTEIVFACGVLAFPFLALAGFMVLAAVLVKWVLS